MEYVAVIGLEVHAQLLTKSKMFCSCSTQFGAEPNSHTCPVCLGMPGVLPVINRKAVEFAIMTALATNCKISFNSIFARKNYFYPDLPKNYQISQYEHPLANDGFIELIVNGRKNKVGIQRVHLEEDAGKLLHLEGENHSYSLIDFNRTGIPLMEIVSKPDISSPEEAGAYLRELRSILRYLEVCDGNMEEGSFRCDANVSIRPAGSTDFGVKTEIKNMNSFKNVEKALEYEILRQKKVIENGEKIIQETRLWDAEKEITLSMRGKEEAHDYRYFPEPDLVPLKIEESWIEEIKEKIPELPLKKLERFIREYNIPFYDAQILTLSRPLADYFEKCVRLYPKSKIISNWIMGDILRRINGPEGDIENCPVTPRHLTGMLELIDRGVISGKIAKTVFEEMYLSGEMPEVIVKKKGLIQVTDEVEIEKVIENVMSENAKEVEEYRKGKEKLFGFFVGQVMKKTEGKANPNKVNELLKKKLSKYGDTSHIS